MRTLSLLVFLSLSFVLAGCGGGSGSATTPKPVVQKPIVTLTISPEYGSIPTAMHTALPETKITWSVTGATAINSSFEQARGGFASGWFWKTINIPIGYPSGQKIWIWIVAANSAGKVQVDRYFTLY